MNNRILPAVLAAALALPAALSAQQIGTVASSEPSLRGTPPGAATRTLAIGSGLVQDETVQKLGRGPGAAVVRGPVHAQHRAQHHHRA